METRDEIQFARAAWRRMKAIEEARDRATAEQVREVLSAAMYGAAEQVPAEYSKGRLAWVSGRDRSYAPRPTSDALYRAGYADAILADMGLSS